MKVLISALALGVVAVLATALPANAYYRATVPTRVHDKQTITISGSEWAPHSTLTVVECRFPFTDPRSIVVNDCGLGETLKLVTTDDVGAFTLPYTIHRRFTAVDGGDVRCAGKQECVLSILNLTQLAAGEFPQSEAFVLGFGRHGS